MNAKSAHTDAYFAEFRRATGVVDERYEVVAFGDSAEMADNLAELVVGGPKRATAGLLRDFEIGGEPMPVVGDHVVVIDGAGRPCGVWRTTEVTVKALIEVDAAFAWDEGEGDRTREDWLDGHRRYFARQAAGEGFAFDDQAQTVFERFVVVWPPESADPGA